MSVMRSSLFALGAFSFLLFCVFSDCYAQEFAGDGKYVEGNVIEAPSAQDVELEDDVFFDADNLVPQGEMAKSGPVKVNPRTQPASKLVIVKKNNDAGDKEARLVSAERALDLGRYESALELFDALYAKNSKDPRVLMGKAVSLQHMGRFDEAMESYERLSKVEPDSVEVKVNMLGLLSTRYPSIALRRLLDLYDKDKGSAALIAQIGMCYAKLGDIDGAAKYLGMVASMEPDNANHLYNLAVMSDRAGDKKKAVTYYEKALEIDSVSGSGRSIPREAVYERLATIR